MIASYPWYISDWRQDEDVLNMTAEQQGIYRNLLDICWDQGSLPPDEKALRKFAMCEGAEWRRAWPVVRGKFTEIEGRLHNAKVDAKRPEVLRAAASRTQSASNAARLRWESVRSASRTAEPMPDACAAHSEGNADLCGTLPYPTLPNQTCTPGASESTWTGPDYEDLARQIWERFPKARRGPLRLVQDAVLSAFSPYPAEEFTVQAARCMRNLAGYLASGDVAKGVCYGAAKWISDGHWRTETEHETPQPRKGKGSITDIEDGDDF